MTDEERVIEVEIRAAHLEKTVNELSEVVYRQQRELDAIRALVQQLRDKLVAEPGLVERGTPEKPPHY